MNSNNGARSLRAVGRGLLWMLAVVCSGSWAHAQKPNTIPALQEWQAGSGSYSFSASSRIVLDSSFATQLAATGKVFQEDLLALTGLNISIVNGSQGSLAPGDIFLSLGSADDGLGTEGYALTITDRILVSAKADGGAFYGTRTLLQLLKQSTTIAAGTARDYPRYPLRALHVDNGRKWITARWLKDHIKELAYLKMNLFHWHLAEWNNFRLESTTHPEVVATDHYTKADLQEMVALAAKYHVTIMPEFEMPGHMGWALAKHPELRAVDSSGNASADNLDLTNPAAYTLVNDLLQEFLPQFPGPYFHLGTDEYITDFTKYPQFTAYAQAHFGPSGNAKDVYLNFINWADGIVRASGKTAWVWDDSKTGGSAISLNKDFILDSWTFAAQNGVNQGYSHINCAAASLYYVWYTDWEPMQTQLYEQWAPNQWTYGNPGSLPPYAKGLLGAKLALWFDNNQCEEYSMAWGMHNSMRTVGQQTWASPKLVSRYTDFKAISDALGRAPGTTFPAALPPHANPNGPYTAQAGATIAFSSSGSTASNGSIATYRWDFGDGGTSLLANPTHAYASAGKYTASLIVTDNLGMTGGNQAQVTVTPSGVISVVISPTTTTLAPGATRQFTATVTGTSNTAVTWSASGGTVNASGLYTAPATAGNYVVTATSVADSTQKANAAVTVQLPAGVTVSLSPSSVTLAPGATQPFTAAVSGTSNTAVTWSTSGGTVNASGLYTAPTTLGSYIVTATSVADTTKSATATVNVSAASGNLALGKPTIASSQYSAAYAPSLATDGDAAGTRWCASGGANGQWLMVDLGASFHLTGTEVKWESGGGVWQYKIDVSNDGTAWTSAVDRTSNTLVAQIYDDTCSVDARYVRITATTNQPGHWASIYDFKVFGGSVAPNPTNLALGALTTASSQYSATYAPSMATDSDVTGTRWCASDGSNGQWLMVDLGALCNLTGSEVKWENGVGVWQYKVEVSTDNTNWSLAVDRTQNTTPAQTYDDPLIVTARYVRLTATTNQPGHWASIYDFKVLGTVLNPMR